MALTESPLPVDSTDLAAITAAIGDAVVAVDETGTVRGWLGGAEALFGWSAEEAVGRSLGALLVPPDLRDRFEALASAGVAAIGRGPFELPARRRDGATLSVEVTVGHGDAQDGPLLVGLVRDVSRRHEIGSRLRLAQERFSSAFEHAPIGMTMSGPDGAYLRANRAFCRLVGRSHLDLDGLAWSAVTHPDDRADEAERRKRLLAGADAEHFEKRYLRPDGRVVLAAVTIVLVRQGDGAPLHFLTQVRDITEERRVLRALERSNRELEEFAAVASHDLRAPLAVVDGFLELLRCRHGDGLNEEANTFVRHAESAVKGMRELLDSMLRLARHEAHVALEPQPVDLREVAVQALAGVSGEARVDLGQLPVVIGDAELLRQVLQNLLGNALRHADPRDPRVRISATATGDAWCVSVADNGAGVAPADRERVFERYTRGERHGAAGLGLAICRRAVERMGGRIWLDEAPGGGADVRFMLPRR